MPIHDLGYRPWDGQRTPDATRWFVIASTGIRVVWRSTWVRRMLMLAWFPTAYVAFSFFAFEQYVKEVTEERERRTALHEQLQTLPPVEELNEQQIQGLIEEGHAVAGGQVNRQFRNSFFYNAIKMFPDSEVVLSELMKHDEYPERARPVVWSWILMTFFRVPQGMLMLLIIGLIAPPLIANDVRSRAFLLYFSRPISLLEYVIGKAAIVWFFLALITVMPALVLYLLGIMLSPDLTVLANTWQLPLQILAASVVLIVPTTAFALMLSSVTSESRFAGFAWFAAWALGWVAYRMIDLSFRESQMRNIATQKPLPREWTLVSLYHILGEAQSWVFGLSTDRSAHLYAIAVLAAITLFSLFVLYRRVSAPVRI